MEWLSKLIWISGSLSVLRYSALIQCLFECRACSYPLFKGYCEVFHSVVKGCL